MLNVYTLHGILWSRNGLCITNDLEESNERKDKRIAMMQ